MENATPPTYEETTLQAPYKEHQSLHTLSSLSTPKPWSWLLTSSTEKWFYWLRMTTSTILFIKNIQRNPLLCLSYSSFSKYDIQWKYDQMWWSMWKCENSNGWLWCSLSTCQRILHFYDTTWCSLNHLAYPPVKQYYTSRIPLDVDKLMARLLMLRTTCAYHKLLTCHVPTNNSNFCNK